ncbi:MAG: hypothetical protein M3349_07695 [Actinomycetota bacterium]|nr:hypothetical protein [Actinomycetota bacterium]
MPQCPAYWPMGAKGRSTGPTTGATRPVQMVLAAGAALAGAAAGNGSRTTMSSDGHRTG